MSKQTSKDGGEFEIKFMVTAQYAPWPVLSIQPEIWYLSAAHCQHHKTTFTRLVYLTNICHLRIFVNCGNGVLVLVLTNRVCRWVWPKSKELNRLFNWRRRLSLRCHDWFTRWFKYDRNWFVCKQAALRSICATLREWSHNLHPPSCSG